MLKSIQMLGSRLRVYLLHICSKQGPELLNLQNVVRDHADCLAAVYHCMDTLPWGCTQVT